jgi:hypothetical protein
MRVAVLADIYGNLVRKPDRAISRGQAGQPADETNKPAVDLWPIRCRAASASAGSPQRPDEASWAAFTGERGGFPVSTRTTSCAANSRTVRIASSE